MKIPMKLIVTMLLTAGLTFSGSAFAQTVGSPPDDDDEAAMPDVGEADEADDEADDSGVRAASERRDADDAEDAPELSDAADVSSEVDVGGDAHPAASNSIVLAPHVGVLFPQVASDLGTWPVFGLSAGYILPFDVASFTRPLEVGLDLMYTQPGADGSGTSPNLGEDGADYDWELTQRMLIVELYALYRFMAPGEFISAYAHIGPRAYFMEAEMEATGNGGQDFGTNTQTNDEYGLVFGGGADFAVGPGTIYGALEFGWSNLDQRITGDSNTGAINLDVGYRLYF
jgi:opacity protein-like surface antigen